MSASIDVSPLARVARVRVGTANRPKLEAVRLAFGAYREGVTVEGVAVDSGVPDQPVGFEEIVRGARNRATAAAASGDCDLSVGIEDGLVKLDGSAGAPVLNVGCAIVSDGEREGLGISSGFAYPAGCLRSALDRRAPIGDLFDAYWRQHRSGAAHADGSASALTSGNVGKLTLGVLNRSEYARHAVVCALIRFLHPDLYAPPPLAARTNPAPVGESR